MTSEQKADRLYHEHGRDVAIIVAKEMIENAGFVWGHYQHDLAISARDQYRKYWMEVLGFLKK